MNDWVTLGWREYTEDPAPPRSAPTRREWGVHTRLPHGERQRLVLEWCRTAPKISARALTRSMGLSPRNAHSMLVKLEEKGLLRRSSMKCTECGQSHGYWSVV